MSRYDPRTHHRRSIRLKEYDYASMGLYFVIICVQNKACLFGKIADRRFIPNEAGQMVQKWYYALEEKFPRVRCHEMVVMPNHSHGIIEITAPPSAVGADPRVCPSDDNGETMLSNRNPPSLGETRTPPRDKTGAPLSGEHVGLSSDKTGTPLSGEHVGSPLHGVVRWFKTMTTNEYIRGVKNDGWPRFNCRLWQQNYYEHIIRHERAYRHIAMCIAEDPARWAEDKFYA